MILNSIADFFNLGSKHCLHNSVKPCPLSRICAKQPVPFRTDGLPQVWLPLNSPFKFSASRLLLNSKFSIISVSSVTMQSKILYILFGSAVLSTSFIRLSIKFKSLSSSIVLLVLKYLNISLYSFMILEPTFHYRFCHFGLIHCINVYIILPVCH